MKLTLGDIKTNIARLISMSGTDTRVAGYINEAQQRLAYKGKWPGTYAKYSLTNTSGTITWPRQLETIESVAIDDKPGVVRNEWYEFLESGPGLRDSSDGDSYTLIDRGEAATFSDINGVNKKLRVYSGVTADAGVRVLLQGYDADGEWIRTQDDGKWVDGEYATLTTTYVETNNIFSSLSAAQKPITEGNVKVYEYLPADETQRVIADYQPTETHPVYRRSLISGLEDDDTAVVTVIGKLRFVPAVNDSDWLYIGYEAAIKEMVLSIRKAENNLVKEADAYEARAVQLLQDQLMHHLGDGQVAIPRFQNSNTFGGGGVAHVV